MRVWFETDRVLPEIAMIARGNPTKSARKKVASTKGANFLGPFILTMGRA